MTNSPFNLYFKIGENYYLGGTIRAVHENVEMFFHYPWGSGSEASLQEFGSSERSPFYLPDHISFHQDGTIQAKSKDKNKRVGYLNRLKADGNIFNLRRGFFVPIYVETINLSQEKYIEKRFRKVLPSEISSDSYWDLTGLAQFSIILVSKCSRINPSKLLSDHGFENLNIIGKPAILCDLFTYQEKNKLAGGSLSSQSTELLIMCVANGWAEDPPQQPHGKVLAGVAVTMPPMELIGKMQKAA